jgi:dihydroorotase-like cyclic amidohydrolase
VAVSKGNSHLASARGEFQTSGNAFQQAAEHYKSAHTLALEEILGQIRGLWELLHKAKGILEEGDKATLQGVKAFMEGDRHVQEAGLPAGSEIAQSIGGILSALHPRVDTAGLMAQANAGASEADTIQALSQPVYREVSVLVNIIGDYLEPKEGIPTIAPDLSTMMTIIEEYLGQE